MIEMGKRHAGEEDYDIALEYFTKAAELGYADAHYGLSILYEEGRGVEKDIKKAVYHLEQAIIGGHPIGRHNLGLEEAAKNGRFDRARKHFIINANLGYQDSLKGLKELYAFGRASKEDYSSALRAYQAAVEEMKSPDREKAEVAMRRMGKL